MKTKIRPIDSVRLMVKNHGLNDLIDKYDIRAKYHKQYPNLVCLSYDRHDYYNLPFVRQCRGIILDLANDNKIVSYPFDKFFNYNESLASSLKWSVCKAYEKLDGSIMTLYFYDDVWHVQSKTIPDGSGKINDCSVTFADIFWQIWDELNYQFPVNTNCCYMFEMVSSFNQNIVEYSEPNLVLIGVRNLINNQELEINESFGYNLPKQFNPDNIFDLLSKLKPCEGEGFVLVDRYFQRVKVKSLDYIKTHYLKYHFSDLNLLYVLLLEEGNEFLSYLPEYQNQVTSIQNKLDCLTQNVNNVLVRYKDIESQKDFAIAVKDLPYKHILFAMRKYNCSADVAMRQINLKYLSKLL